MNLQEALKNRINEIMEELRKDIPKGFKLYQDGIYTDMGKFWVRLALQNIQTLETTGEFWSVEL